MLSQQIVRPWGFSSLQSSDGSLHFYCLRYIPYFPLKLHWVLQYLLLAHYQWLQIGLDLKSDLPMHSGDMIGWWWQYHQLWVRSRFSCFWPGNLKRCRYEEAIILSLQRRRLLSAWAAQYLNLFLSSQCTFFIIKWSFQTSVLLPGLSGSFALGTGWWKVHLSIYEFIVALFR